MDPGGAAQPPVLLLGRTQHSHRAAAGSAQSKSLQKAATHFIKKYGAPDIVIANAGVSTGTLAGEKEDFHTFKRVIEINLFGVIHTFLPFIKIFKNYFFVYNSCLQLFNFCELKPISICNFNALPF